MDTASKIILVEGLIDWVDLGQIHWHVAQENPSAPVSEVQKKTLEMIRSLATDGLFEVGDLVGKRGRFVAWDTPLEESMQRVRDVYVTDFDDRNKWPWLVWLNLTDKGQRIAQPLQEKYRHSLRKPADVIKIDERKSPQR